MNATAAPTSPLVDMMSKRLAKLNLPDVKLGSWQLTVLRDASATSWNPLKDIKGTARNYRAKYHRSLLDMIAAGLLAESPGPRGGFGIVITPVGEQFMGANNA